MEYEKANGVNHGFDLDEASQIGQVRKIKGLPRMASSKITFLEYYNVLRTEEVIMSRYEKFMSRDHMIHKISQQKTALTSMDDKRFYLRCNIHSLAYENCIIQSSSIDCSCLRVG